MDDALSKNVCIIGILHILGCAVFSIAPLKNAIYIVDILDNPEEWSSSKEFIVLLVAVALFILIIVLAGLMIRGVLKANQRYALVAPFLVFSSLTLAAKIVLAFSSVVLDHLRSFYYIEEYFYGIGVQIMILYPVCALFLKLRSQSINEKSHPLPALRDEKKKNDKLIKKLCV